MNIYRVFIRAHFRHDKNFTHDEFYTAEDQARIRAEARYNSAVGRPDVTFCYATVTKFCQCTKTDQFGQYGTFEKDKVVWDKIFDLEHETNSNKPTAPANRKAESARIISKPANTKPTAPKQESRAPTGGIALGSDV